MSIALLSVVVFQVIWFNNALALKNKLYEQNVLSGMQETIVEIENKEAARFVNNKLLLVDATPDRVLPVGKPNKVPDKPHKKLVSNSKDNFNYTVINQTTSYSFDSSTEGAHAGKTIIKIDTHTLDSNLFAMGEDRKNFSIDSIINSVLVANPITSVSKKIFTYSYTNTDKKDTLIRQQKEETASRHKIAFVIDKLAQEFVQSKHGIEDRVPADTIKKLLLKNLAGKSITDSFIFCVKRDTLTKTAIDSMGISAYEMALFPHDINKTDMVLQVAIPHKETYVIKSMGWHLMGSIGFTLLIIATFAYSIYIMLRQKKLAEVKNDFINNMTHEFKTPIATISLAVSTIEQNLLAKNELPVGQYLEAIKEENIRMHKQVESVLQLALSSEKQFEPKLTACNLHALISEINNTYTLIALTTQHTICLELNANKYMVEAEVFYLQHAITNVLDNALKYSANGSKVSIQTYNEQNLVCIKIIDEGIGMKQHDKKNIFRKFYRVQTGNIHNVKGFGIGLSYTQNIIQAHKGFIEVESEFGRGTSFIIKLKTTA